MKPRLHYAAQGHATHKQEMGITKCKTYQGRWELHDDAAMAARDAAWR